MFRSFRNAIRAIPSSTFPCFPALLVWAGMGARKSHYFDSACPSVALLGARLKHSHGWILFLSHTLLFQLRSILPTAHRSYLPARKSLRAIAIGMIYCIPGPACRCIDRLGCIVVENNLLSWREYLTVGLMPAKPVRKVQVSAGNKVRKNRVRK